VKPLEKVVSEAADREEVIPVRWHPEADRGAEADIACVVVEVEEDARGVEDAENRVGDPEEAIF
jgi:hypothetical protein